MMSKCMSLVYDGPRSQTFPHAVKRDHYQESACNCSLPFTL